MLEKSADVSKIQTVKQKKNYILNLYKFLGKVIKSECLNIFCSWNYKQGKLTAGLLAPPPSPPRPGRVKAISKKKIQINKEAEFHEKSLDKCLEWKHYLVFWLCHKLTANIRLPVLPELNLIFTNVGEHIMEGRILWLLCQDKVLY